MEKTGLQFWNQHPTALPVNVQYIFRLVWCERNCVSITLLFSLPTARREEEDLEDRKPLKKRVKELKVLEPKIAQNLCKCLLFSAPSVLPLDEGCVCLFTTLSTLYPHSLFPPCCPTLYPPFFSFHYIGPGLYISWPVWHHHLPHHIYLSASLYVCLSLLILTHTHTRTRTHANMRESVKEGMSVCDVIVPASLMSWL